MSKNKLYTSVSVLILIAFVGACADSENQNLQVYKWLDAFKDGSVSDIIIK